MPRWLLPAKGHNSRLTSAWLSFAGDRAYFGADREVRDSCIAAPRPPKTFLSSALWGMMRGERVLTGSVLARAVACAVLLACALPVRFGGQGRVQSRGRQGRARCRRPRAHPVHCRSVEEGRCERLRARQSLSGHRRCARCELSDARRRRQGEAGTRHRLPLWTVRAGKSAHRARYQRAVPHRQGVRARGARRSAGAARDRPRADRREYLPRQAEGVEVAASSERRAVSPGASAVASGRREARGGIGPRPRRRRSGDQQRHRHHREGGRARPSPALSKRSSRRLGATRCF